MIEIVLPNGDRAECDRDAASFTARTLIDDAVSHGAASSYLRRGVTAVDEQGEYDGAATRALREGSTR